MIVAQEKHIPVLYGELIESLHFFKKGKNIIIDCTLGLGGHASGIIEKLGKGDIFIGIDCDTDNLSSARETLMNILKLKPENEQPTVYCIHSNFSKLDEVITNIGNYRAINNGKELNELGKPTSIYADLGVSSVHFDTAERGFSFRLDGPLDMRLDTSKGITATSLINSLPYNKMAEIFRLYGDESRAGFIAKKIIEAREIAPLTSTLQLAEVVIKAWRDSLPRIFQALRIAVNEEYAALESLLDSATNHLAPGGSLSIIAFHSGEDRIVKHFFREKSTAEKDTITGQDKTAGILKVLTKKPITPSEDEIKRNHRARSALLRIAIKN